MGMAELENRQHPMRRDRLLFLNALAILLLTLLGAAGESLGMDNDLRTSTTKRRTHSLFRQGCMWFGLIPNMPEPRLRPLLIKFWRNDQSKQSPSKRPNSCRKMRGFMSLGARPVIDADKGTVGGGEADAFRRQSPRQPAVAVAVELQAERRPGRRPQIRPSSSSRK